MTLYHAGDGVVLYQGDAATELAQIPDDSVNCVVTSPPYFGLRDYGVAGQIGLEPSPVEYVAQLVAVFNQVKRALRPDGTLWLNLGDSYYSGKGNPGPNAADSKQPARRGWTRSVDQPGQPWGQQKGLLGIPWRVAFALQDTGWILRNAVIWNKPNAMPESVGDRLACRYEHVFLFTKSRKYWFDLDPIREPLLYPDKTGHTFGGNHPEVGRRRGAKYEPANRGTNRAADGQRHVGGHPNGKNPGDVWSISTTPYRGAHFATFPPKLVERCVLAGCPPHGVVLDPFVGSGTALMVARDHGHVGIGVELNPEYLELAKQRLGLEAAGVTVPQEQSA